VASLVWLRSSSRRIPKTKPTVVRCFPTWRTNAVSQAIDKSIVEKIRKLLALADSSKNSHEHEREVAMQAALDLLGKHNLSLTQVNNSLLEIRPEEVRANFKLDPWIRFVLSGVCKF
jgi:Protein of unknown function (DUF2786)